MWVRLAALGYYFENTPCLQKLLNPCVSNLPAATPSSLLLGISRQGGEYVGQAHLGIRSPEARCGVEGTVFQEGPAKRRNQHPLASLGH